MIYSYRVTVRADHETAVRAALDDAGAGVWGATPCGPAVERAELWAMAREPGADPRLAAALNKLPPAEAHVALLVDARASLGTVAGVVHAAIDRPLTVTPLDDLPPERLYCGAAGDAYRAFAATSYRARRAGVIHLRPALEGLPPPRRAILAGVGDAATELALLDELPSVDDVTCHDSDEATAQRALDAVVAFGDARPSTFGPIRVDYVAGALPPDTARAGLGTMLGYTVGNGDGLLDALRAVAERVICDAPIAAPEHDHRYRGDTPPDFAAGEAAWLRAAAGGDVRHFVVPYPDGYEIRAVVGDWIAVRYRRRTDEGWRAHFARRGWRVEVGHVTATTQPIGVYRLVRSKR